MSQPSYEEVLQSARQLSPEERERLARELARTEPQPNGESTDNESIEVRTLGDAFRERGLLGGMTDGPPDLGTNPKYMGGFGEHAD